MAYRVLTEAELLNEKSMGPGVKGVRLALSLEVLEKDGCVLLATTAEGLTSSGDRMSQRTLPDALGRDRRLADPSYAADSATVLPMCARS